MEPNKPKSIFDSPSRKPIPTCSIVRGDINGPRKSDTQNRHQGNQRSSRPKEPSDLNNSIIKNKEGCFELVPPERKPRIGNLPDPKLLDEYDGMPQFEMTIENVLGSHLMQMIPIDDITSGSYDNFEIEMKALTKDGGVRKIIIQNGNGTKVPMDSTVWVKYIGFVEGNDDPIDAYSSREKMSSINIGEGAAFAGLLIAFQSMEVGEISKFLISSEYGYGKLGCPNLIPPNSRLFYAIEMVKFTVGPEEKPVWKMSSKEQRKLDFEVVFKAADNLREAGNQKAKFKLYHSALERYEKGLKILKNACILLKKEEVQMFGLKYIFYSNLALCYLQLDEPNLAVTACKAALGPDMPTAQAKLYFRYATALLKLEKAEEAEQFSQKAEQLDPRDSKILELQRQIRSALHKEDKVKINLWKKMCKVPLTTLAED